MRYLPIVIICSIFFQGCKEKDMLSTFNKDAAKMVENIETEIDVAYENGVCIPKSKNNYPRVIVGKDGRKYVASLSAVYDKNKKLRVRIDVSGSTGGYWWTSWNLDCRTK